MAIMIIGGTGFVGSHLARYLIQEKGESGIVLFDAAANYERIADILDHVSVVQGDILELSELLQTMQQYKVDRIVHTAYVLGEDNTTNPSRSIKVNCLGTTNVFEAARLHGAARVVFASAGAVYPLRNVLSEEEVNEDVAGRPNSLYGACKLFNELEAEVYWNTFGLDVISLRVNGVFGLGRVSKNISKMDQHGMGNYWVNGPGLAFMGRPVVMPPDEQVVVWIHTSDAAEAFYCALTVEKPKHRVFNMHSGPLRVGDCTRHLRMLLPDAQISISAEPAVAPRLTSNQRLRTELGFQPQYTIERALDDYFQAIRTGVGLP